MKNTILIALLVASLGLNIWFAITRTGSRPTDSSAANQRAGSAGAAVATAAAPTRKNTETPARPFVWKTAGTSDEEMRTLVADLRAAGFPPRVIARIVSTKLRDRVYAKLAEMPFWQLNANTRAVRKAESEARRELQRLQEELLGPAGSQLATLDPTQRRERYGDLPDDKVAALLQIDRDYQDVAADILPSGGAINLDESQAFQEQFRAMERERRADIQAALGPEAFAAYERQNSGTAMMVMRGLRDLKVSAEEYDALFAAQKARVPDESSLVFSNLVDPAQLPATYAFNDQVRAILGEERAHTYLKSADPIYGQVARFAEQQTLTPATTYALYQLQNEAQLTMQQLNPRSGGGTSVSSADVEKARQTFADLNARLETLVGAAAANAFRSQGSGSVFRSFVPRPATSPTPASGNASPAVRLPGAGGG
jgi:hypothetical protein